jgi:hypothetical protein
MSSRGGGLKEATRRERCSCEKGNKTQQNEGKSRPKDGDGLYTLVLPKKEMSDVLRKKDDNAKRAAREGRKLEGAET